MKNFTLFLTAFLFSIASLAQSPGGINYQTVIRDGSGNELANIPMSLKMSIRTGTPDGTIVYVETHEVTSNSWELVNLIVGNGTIQSGSFSEINWGSGEKYLETAIDTQGNGNYTILGVTQFLSVPYSLHAANGNYSMTTEERDALVDPPLGMQIFNITTNCLNYFNGYGWYKTCGDCTPMPSPSNAGPDQYFSDTATATTLDANTPEYGTGTWSVVSGNGGSFEDVNDPNTLFTGQACQVYDLKWTITSTCGANEDLVSIEFDTPPSPANAGPDQTYNDATVSTILEGNTPVLGVGTWSVETGSGGSFENVNDPTTLFTGAACETYILKWIISNPCGTSEDQVEIVFNTPPTTADAGPDQYFDDATISTNLEGNTPVLGVGTWSVESGTGGSFENANDPTTFFTGTACETYILKWIISNPCGSSEDQVEIVFNTPPTAADAGPDQYFEDATVSTMLEGNTPLLGVGTWSVETGTGGSFENVNDPTTLFTGTACETYILKWIISNPCGSSEDQVEIVLNTPPTTADAGPDQLDVAGTSTSLSANAPLLGSGEWSILSGTGGNIAEAGNPTSTFTGTEGLSYELQWSITNNCGASTDNVMISFAGGGGDWTCGDPFMDLRDNQQYTSVQIGDQCWMAENLAYLPTVSPPVNGSTTDPFYYVYGYQGTDVEEAKATGNFQTYGTLYNYPASQLACPDGWNNPSDDEWKILEGTVDSQYPVGDPEWDGGGWRGFDAGKNLKATSGWDDNGNGVDLYNFSSLPGGFRYSGGFGSLGNQGFWWSATEVSTFPAKVWGRNMWIGDIKSARYDYDKDMGRAVRCLKSDFLPVNQAPESPSSPNPEDASTEQATNTTLSWTCTDPESDPLTYDVYFGTDNPPTQVATGQSESTYDPGTLQYNNQYFWKIVAHDDQGNSTEGAVWSFNVIDAPPPVGEVYNPATGRTWMDRNLGASRVAISKYDAAAYGDLYQWGRATEGHEIRTSETTSTNATTAEANLGNPWDGLFIGEYYSPYDWLTPQDNSLWQGESGVNNPCPTGFRLPSKAEWEAERNSWATNDLTGAYGSPLKLVAGGFRRFDNGWFQLVGSEGNYWSSTINGIVTWDLNFSNSNAAMYDNYRTYGLSVRCIKEGSTNQAPSQPSNPSPADASTDQAVNSTLSWSCSDPDSDPLTYDVYFGTENPPAQVATGQSETTYDPGTLQFNTQYFWKIVAHDDQGNSTEGEVWTFTTIQEQVLFVCGDIFTDERDNNVYSSVQIGTQCWMAENLQIGTRVDGSVDQTNNAIIEKYCYDDNDLNCDEYGGLYQWNEMMGYNTTAGTPGICPEGWHLPADDEWCTLENYVDAGTILCDATGWRGVDVGGNLKETGTSHWNSPNNGASNSSGFTGLPGSYRDTDGSFNYLTNFAGFWSSSGDGSDAWYRYLDHGEPRVGRGSFVHTYGFSVRCIRDEEIINQPPAQPSSPSPADASTDQATNTTLSWACTDPESDPLTYDVYFGTDNPPTQVATGQSETTYDPGTLQYSTLYFWKIVASDDQGNTTEGAVWSFSSEAENLQPDQPANPSPENGASNQPAEGSILSWSCTDPEGDPLTYDIYLSTDNPPTQLATGQTETSYDPGILEYTSTYFWKIVAHDNQGNSTESVVWSFATGIPPNLPPNQPYNPNPQNGATNQPIEASTLSWTCTDPEGDPLTYEVYFGETNPPSLVDHGQTATTYNAGTLNGSTSYYWKIVANDDQVNTTIGEVWSFTTEWACGAALIDARDSQTYNTVLIGTQCWMAENLNIGTRINSSSNQTNNGTIEKYCYDNSTSNCDVYGDLYQWDEMMGFTTTEGTQGICPTGWHLPTHLEWVTLTTFLGGSNIAGGKLKEAGTVHWNSPNTSATNSSGFTGLPGGYRLYAGAFSQLGSLGFHWTSTLEVNSDGRHALMNYNNESISLSSSSKTVGFTVLCIKD